MMTRYFVTKCFPPKLAPIYKAYVVTEQQVIKCASSRDILDLVKFLEIAVDRVITFDDASRVDFYKAL